MRPGAGSGEPGAGSRLRALQAIVFDFDGVIADSERLHLKAYQDILAPEGIQVSENDYYDRYLGNDDTGVFKAIGKDQGVPMNDLRIADLTMKKGARFEELSAQDGTLFPGAVDFIRSAVAAQVPIAIASGALTHEIVEVLERAGIRGLFPVIVGADCTERSKPDPQPYQLAFTQLCAHTGRALEPSRSVAIEDSRWGLVSARAAGLRCVAVTNTYAAAELREDAELVVDGLEALTLEALDALCAD